MKAQFKQARSRRLLSWGLWLSLSAATLMGLFRQMTNSQASRSVFLPGKTTDGHYQIEGSCQSCHTVDFSDRQDMQAACVKCHGGELEEAQDSHPRSKFTDPRNAERVALLDARECVTCHVEHSPDRTSKMGLSLPEDYCYRCHQDIAEDRPSHDGLPFSTYADAGCHNFHDNRALYEDYLVKHASEPVVLAAAFRSLPSEPQAEPCAGKLRASQNDAAAVESCAACHDRETSSWLAGRHGMRLSLDLSPMTPGQARLPMKKSAANISLSCGSCHGGDPSGPRKEPEQSSPFTQVEACLTCHDDAHSLAYKSSPHFALFEAELAQKVAAGSGVTCATCHMPRTRDDDGRVWVQHNQNHNLRPNEKMVRTSCANCHGLAFSLDALADPHLIETNFSGRPSAHVKSVDFAVARN